jgi:4-amino-4-deoxychorismate lyase
VDDLETVAYVNYGHFTAMLARPGGVRGLSLHLDRLDRDAKIVFGHGIDREEVRTRVREALAGHELPANVRVTVFARDISFAAMADLPEPDFLVKVRPVRPARANPPRIRSTVYARDLPEVKHVGTFGLYHQLRLAQQAGYDDALFVDEDGRVAECSVWNIGFYDGERIVWPSAPALPGIEMQLLQEGMRRLAIPTETREVRLGEISGFRSAFLTNAPNGPVMIGSIDDVTFSQDTEPKVFLTAAHDAVADEPLVASDTATAERNDLGSET